MLIDSADPHAKAKIRYGYLTDPDDWRVMLSGFEQSRRIFASPSLAPYIVREKAPGSEVTSEAELEAFARREGTTLYHPVGTAKMGAASDPHAVVDERLRFYGIDGLRIVDASVMPSIPSANTAASTMMIAEKAADLIRGKRLP